MNQRRRRNTLRLPGHDYAQPGYYFITIVTQNRQPLFGEIAGDRMIENEAGRAANAFWRALPDTFTNVVLDTHIVMPNHVHGLLMLDHVAGGHVGPPLQRIVALFKTVTTNAYIRLVDAGRAEPFERRLWQRGYHDRVVRDDDEAAHIRAYIETNPLHWHEDEENPANRVVERL